ncbi:hypothetical protein EVAR_38076_1 [Eumeta japonica]|uniref:Uncharacterized protein n=1 Tax=Eumeta variegata TaxID=151549 RepID=A0A4C1W8T4_EUMVA|nr:hypothetical protein EVAR_38076_1 [Eumeta japonica]
MSTKGTLAAVPHTYDRAAPSSGDGASSVRQGRSRPVVEVEIFTDERYLATPPRDRVMWDFYPRKPLFWDNSNVKLMFPSSAVDLCGDFILLRVGRCVVPPLHGSNLKWLRRPRAWALGAARPSLAGGFFLECAGILERELTLLILKKGGFRRLIVGLGCAGNQNQVEGLEIGSVYGVLTAPGDFGSGGLP